jgi:hypothetical protein
MGVRSRARTRAGVSRKIPTGPRRTLAGLAHSEGPGTWGDGRLISLGTESYIELRKYADIATSDRPNQPFLVDGKGEHPLRWHGRIPGINRHMAEVIIAKAGTDMSQFPNARHFASWIGLCPGQNESAGKRRSGKTRKGNRSLHTALLVEASHGAVRKKGSYFGAQYRRIAARRGKKKTLVAIAHSMTVTIFNILKNQTAYVELGDQFFDKLNPSRVLNRLTRRIQNLGFQVQLSPATLAA